MNDDDVFESIGLSQMFLLFILFFSFLLLLPLLQADDPKYEFE